MGRSLNCNSRHFGGQELFSTSLKLSYSIITAMVITRVTALTACWLCTGVQRAGLPSFFLYSCLHHWLPHHTEDLGDIFHVCPYFISKINSMGGGREVGDSQTKLHAPYLSSFSTKTHFMLQSLDFDTVLKMPSRTGAKPRGVPATHCEAKWALQGSLATSCRYRAAVWLLLSQTSQQRGGNVNYTRGP